MVWDSEVDVVVVGFGGAGSAAAITAHDLGGEVIILEAQPEATHCPQTKLLAGGAMFVTDVNSGASYLNACAQGMTPAAVSRAWAEKAVNLREWIETLDPDRYRLYPPIASAEHPELPGAEAIVSSTGFVLGPNNVEAPARGAGLFEALATALARRHVPIYYGCRARRLIQDPDGRVSAVEYEQRGQRRTIGARRGVVLATGGYGANEELKRQFLPAYPVYFYGSPNALGDGILLAQAAGAALWHMTLLMGRGVANFRLDDGSDLSVIVLLTAMGNMGDPAGYVVTDGFGRRFANEATQASLGHGFYFHMIIFDPEKHCYPRVPSFWIFDEKRRRAGPVTIPGYGALAVRRYDWSSDNQAEIAKGWIAKGNTIREAASAAGIDDPDCAQESVAAYNSLCAQAKPDPFGRPAETMVPLDCPPYYCLPLWPGGTNTSGGPRRDERGRIIHAFGHVLPGLFGAGECGLSMGMLYPGVSAYYSEVLCSGRIAGENVMDGHIRGQAFRPFARPG